LSYVCLKLIFSPLFWFPQSMCLPNYLFSRRCLDSVRPCRHGDVDVESLDKHVRTFGRSFAGKTMVVCSSVLDNLYCQDSAVPSVNELTEGQVLPALLTYCCFRMVWCSPILFRSGFVHFAILDLWTCPYRRTPVRTPSRHSVLWTYTPRLEEQTWRFGKIFWTLFYMVPVGCMWAGLGILCSRINPISDVMPMCSQT
jgi:hypothetical protein